MVGFLDHWQTLVGSLLGAFLGFMAAVWTIKRTLSTEERRAVREDQSIRRSLIAELRQLGLRALEAHQKCVVMADAGQDLKFLMLEDAARFPDAVVFPLVAARLDVIGADAEHVLFFYGQIDMVRQGLERVRTGFDNRHIPPDTAMQVAKALVDMCRTLGLVLPNLIGSTAPSDPRDARFLVALNSAVDVWDRRHEVVP